MLTIRKHITLIVVLLVIAFIGGHVAPVFQTNDSATIRVDGKTCQVNDVSRIDPGNGSPDTLVFARCR